jgi:hypothetical protein
MRLLTRTSIVATALCLSAVVGATGAGLLPATPASATPASAAPAVAASSAAGNYLATLTFEGAQIFETLKLSANGTFDLQGLAVSGHWNQAGKTIKLVGTLNRNAIKFTAKRIGRNLGSKKSPGLITVKNIGVGTWYAKRKK